MNKRNLNLLLLLGVVVFSGFLVSRTLAVSTPSAEVYTNGATPGPTMETAILNPTQVALGGSVIISVKATDVSGISVATANIKRDTGATIALVQLYDDGKHSDGAANDSVFANSWSVGSNGNGTYPVDIQLADTLSHPTVVTSAVNIIIGTGNGNANVNANVNSQNSNNANAGNVNNTNNTNNANVNTTDSTPPTVSITAPAADGATLSTASYSVVANAVDTESLITKVEYYLDAEAAPRDTQSFDNPAGSHNYTWVFNLGGVSTGNHTLKAIAYNGVGLTATVTRTVNVTYTSSAPTNVSITPTSGTYASTAAVSVSVHAQDDTDITRIEVYSSAGGGAIGTANITGTTDTSVDQTISFTASAIAYTTGSTKIAAANWPRIRLPFISVAQAAESENCVTVTTPYAKSIYALAYDDANSTPSSYVTYTVNYTSTQCNTPINSVQQSPSPAL